MKSEGKESSLATTSSYQTFNGKNFNILPKNKRIPVYFMKKIDGDTFRVLLNDKEINVRLLLVDTPESVKQGVAVQPFAIEGGQYTEKKLVNAEKIEIEFDKGKRTDHYGRALCYVYLDGTLLQESLVKEGLARVAYVYKPSTSQLKTLRRAEKSAKKTKKGIWSIPGYVTTKGFNQT
ncbi:thermonuclease family protein [Carnobacterium divergens]|nr:thermonuclease family protein [Carnobacterium divergens]